MTLIILLLALAAERYLHLGSLLYRFSWLPWYLEKAYECFGKTTLWTKSYQAIATIILPVLIVVAIIYYLSGVFEHRIPQFFIGLFIFLYCLGPKDLFHQVNTYLKAIENNDEAKLPNISMLLGEEMPADPKLRETAIVNALFWQANVRLFAVIFWFAVLGPVGAVLYRMTVLLDEIALSPATKYSNLLPALEQLRGYLDWIPARLTSLAYGLVGNFSAVLGYWLDFVFTGINLNRTLLVECGRISLKLDEEEATKPGLIQSALILIDRTTIAYIIAIAVLGIAIWLLL